MPDSSLAAGAGARSLAGVRCELSPARISTGSTWAALLAAAAGRVASSVGSFPLAAASYLLRQRITRQQRITYVHRQED